MTYANLTISGVFGVFLGILAQGTGEIVSADRIKTDWTMEKVGVGGTVSSAMGKAIKLR